MSTVYENLKRESIALRKTKNPIASSITFALSEIEKVGKNNGNRETTEEEAIKVVQKLISTIDENLKLENIDDGRKIAFNFEKRILLGSLPKMVSEEELSDFLKTEKENFDFSSKAVKGDIMKSIKAKYGALVDMKKANELIKSLYNI